MRPLREARLIDANADAHRARNRDFPEIYAFRRSGARFVHGVDECFEILFESVDGDMEEAEAAAQGTQGRAPSRSE